MDLLDQQPDVGDLVRVIFRRRSIFLIIAKIGIRMILPRIIVLKNVLNAGMSLMSNIIQDGTPMDLTLSKKFMESTELLHSPSKKTTHVK